MTILDELAGWVYAAEWDPLTAGAQNSIVDSFVDTVGVALAGSADRVAGIVRDYAVSNSAVGAAEIWGSDHRLAPDGAAIANGTAAMAQEFDDRYVTSGHPSCTLVPALIASAQAAGLGGPAVLRGYVAGLGVFAAVGRLYETTVEPRLEPRGWHVTSVLGTPAAAAAVAKLHGMSRDQIATAIGISLSMTGGMSANFKSPTKAVHPGRAAQSGIVAAALSRAGLTCASDVLDGPHGAMVAFGHGPGSAIVKDAADLGDLLKIAEQAPGGLVRKQFPTFGSTHLAIEAALEVRARLSPGGPATSVQVNLSRGSAKVGFHGTPRTASEARHSFGYVVASALARGFPVPHHFAEDELADPATRSVLGVLNVAESDGGSYAPGDVASADAFAEVIARTGDGAVLRARRVNPPRMLSGSAVDDKFLACARPAVGEPRADELLRMLRALPTLDTFQLGRTVAPVPA